MPLVTVYQTDKFHLLGEAVQPKEWYFYGSLHEASEAEVAEMQRLYVEYQKLQTLLASIKSRSEFEPEARNMSLYPLKGEYPTYDLFETDCRKNGFDIDRSFGELFDQKNDLVGAYTKHQNGAVTVKPV